MINILIGILMGSMALGQFESFSIFPDVRIYLHDLLIAVFALLLFTGRRWRRIGGVHLIRPLAIIAGVMAVSLLANLPRLTLTQSLVSAAYAARYMLYTAVYLFVVTDRRPALWLRALFLTGTTLSVLGLAQLVLYPNLRNLVYLGWDPHYYRAFSTLLDPNFLGIVSVLTVFLGIWLRTRRDMRRLSAFGMVTAAGSLLFTYSRSSYLGLFAGLILYAFLTRRVRYLTVGAVLLIIFVLIPKPNIAGFQLLRADTVVARIGNTSTGMTYFRRAPLVGFGFDTLRYTVPTPPNTDPSIPSHSAAGFDNGIIQILVTTGVIGLLAYAYLWGSMVWVGVRLLRQPKLRLLAVIGLSSLAALFVHGQFVASWFYPWTLIWMWVLVGAMETSLRPSGEE